jgi:hypothetical protein
MRRSYVELSSVLRCFEYNHVQKINGEGLHEAGRFVSEACGKEHPKLVKQSGLGWNPEIVDKVSGSLLNADW